MRGGQIGRTSIELEQTASTLPFMQTHWHAPDAGAALNVAATAIADRAVSEYNRQRSGRMIRFPK
jgi:hypothetical protein